MKNTSAVILFLASLSAHADIVPTILSSTYTATVQKGGASIAYSEARWSSGPLDRVVNELSTTTNQLEGALNSLFYRKTAEKGGVFLSGKITGNPTIAITPQSSGVMSMNFGGLSYEVRTKFTGRKYGLISYECVNTTAIRNLTAIAVYGAATGSPDANSAGMTGQPTSHTDCDSNISWILPILGDFLINQITSAMDQEVVSSIHGEMSKVKGALLYGAGANPLDGLNRIVPQSTVLAGFPIGQYLRDNAAYLLGNSRIDIKIEKGADVRPKFGGMPETTVVTGDVLNFALSSPALAFSVRLREDATVRWTWVCSYVDPRKHCFPDY